MNQLEVLYLYYAENSKDTKGIIKKWEKVIHVIDEIEESEEIHTCINDYSESVERCGFHAGFRAALELIYVCRK